MELNLKDKKSAEYAVSEFFKNWIKKDFKTINKYIQITFLKGNDKVFNNFEKILGNVELKDFYLYDKEIITDCREEINFRAEVLFNGKLVNMYGKANTICEKAPYEPSPNGKWGVNPISILRWVKQK